MNFIKDRVKAINLDLNDGDYDHCHRIGHKYNKNGKTYQRVVLKMCSWRCRNEIYANQKRLAFIISANLTDSRQILSAKSYSVRSYLGMKIANLS